MLRVSMLMILNIFFLSVFSQVNIEEWSTTTGKIEEKEFLGRKALFLNKGLAYLKNSAFSNGVIEVDLATTVMAGISFRIDDANHNYEEVYIRYPKSGGLDAIQYAPDFNGEFSWQFYPEYQAKATFPANEWIHLKIIVENDKAGVYILNKDSAVLLIDSLRVGQKAGKVGLWSLNGAYFSNLKYRDATPEEKLSAIPRKIINNPNAIKEWMISEGMSFVEPPAKITKNLLTQLTWQKAWTEPDGYLNINKYAKKKIWGMTRDNSNDMVWLRYVWEEKAEVMKPFSFEFSNKCHIYFNDAKIFSGDNSFLLKGTFFRGDIDKKMRANTLYLPAFKGKNVLYIAVSGINNGWGFMAQFASVVNTGVF